MKKYTVEIDDSGDIYWYKEGTEILHREDGPAIEHFNGDKYWYQSNKLHRVDGPAVEFVDGSKEWYQNGELHREDGPAAEFADGAKEWYIEGKQYTEAEFNKRLNKNISNSFDGKEVEIDGKKYKLVLSEKATYNKFHIFSDNLK